MAKVEIPLERAHRLLSPGPVVLVTAARKGRTDITPVGWVSSVSSRPPMVAIAVFQGSFIHELIKASGEYVLNIPPLDLLKQVQYCGSVSGRDVDKFQATGLHQAEPRYVGAPLIEECVGHLECAVADVVTPGDHSIFIAEVVAAKAESEAFEDFWLLKEKELKPLHHLGGTYYGVLEGRIDAAAPAAEEPEEGK
jgi:flavin reductase (DIM6/NTAB) family NADH-FMN oxidoreductase RutF